MSARQFSSTKQEREAERSRLLELCSAKFVQLRNRNAAELAVPKTASVLRNHGRGEAEKA
jgi:hypothetical protein